jgi:hypothetical protein
LLDLPFTFKFYKIKGKIEINYHYKKEMITLMV